MRKFPPTSLVELARSAALVIFAMASAIGPAGAQVSVDPRALDALKPETQAKPPARPARPATRPAAKPAPAKPATPNPPPPPPPPSAPPPVIPAAPPPVPVIPPAVVVPVRPVPPPLPAVVTADAPGEALPITDGLRLTFGPGRSDLNPAGLEALRTLGRGAAASATATFNVTAFAAGAPEDTSSPRRLSLARALTVRSVLITQGFASARIYVKALGATTPALAEGPPDRVDVTVVGLRPAAPSAPLPPPAAGAATPPPPAVIPAPTPVPNPAPTQARPAP